MTDVPYLLQLASRLNSGLEHWEPERRARHRDFILAQQQTDGGFAGREGESDLYYTSFALRGLILTDDSPVESLTAASRYLQSHDPNRLNVVDLISWLNSALIVQMNAGIDLLAELPADFADQLAERIESFRREDGGYAKSEQGAAGSTYQSFLSVLCYQFLGKPVPKPNALIQYLYDRQREDGGFVEIAPMKRSGTNPTAAAAVLLTILEAMDDEIREDITHFLKEVRSDEGGFQANTRIPFADGLSTFTALLTMQDLELPGIVNLKQAENFFETQLEFPTGGFRGASWDEQADVEYTFYGLGTLSLLQQMQAS